MEGKSFYIGNPSRVKHYFETGEMPLAFRFRDLFAINSPDTLYNVRPWSVIFVILSFKRTSDRPALVHLADGLLFPLNARKRTNSNPWPLFTKVFGDELWVRQSLGSLQAQIGIEECPVRTTCEFEVIKRSFSDLYSSVVFVAGNDPFLGLDRKLVLREFERAITFIKASGCDNVWLSCTNQWLTRSLIDFDSCIKSIGPLDTWKMRDRKHLFIGTPSTVLFNNFLSERPSVLLMKYDCETLDYLFSNMSVLYDREISVEEKKIKVSHNVKAKRFSSRTQIQKRKIMVELNDLFFHLKPRIIFGELRSLLFIKR